MIAADLKQMEDSAVIRWIILDAPGWPGGYEPTPNNQETARKFQADHGGRIMTRLQSDWVQFEPDEQTRRSD